MPETPEKVQLTTEFIRLDAFLKFTACVGTGGEAKMLIQDGQVFVNGEVCTMRTKKLRNGDTVDFNGKIFEVSGSTQ